jgi:signal transduction histidine kinase
VVPVPDPDTTGLEPVPELPTPVFWKDRRGRYLGSNESYRLCRGLASRDGIIGRTDDDLGLNTQLTERMQAIEDSVLRSGKPKTVIHSWRQDATSPDEPSPEEDEAIPRSCPHTYAFTIFPLKGSDGKTIGVGGTGLDINGLDELDQHLTHTRQLESVRRLAENLSHQINTPVQYITDNVRFIADRVAEALTALEQIDAALASDQSPLPPSVPDAGALRRVQNEVHEALEPLDVAFLVEEVPGAILESLEGLSQIAQIVSALNSYTHTENQRTMIDLSHMVDNIVQLTRPQWHTVGDLRLHLARMTPPLLGYEGELRQVLLNLLLNSVRAVAQRHGQTSHAGLIKVSTSYDPGAGTIRLIITDNGCGMTEQVRSRIFDPFFTTKRLGDASGQGLSLAWTTIVDRHSGTIEVQTEPDVGTTFTLTLPVLDD